ncbi:MAG: efflux RND transporter periplasmic adaptor subunit [Gemmatimonadaceae bacterium]|jgi:HlyD family secretion protein|nr:efflux RND transporter periplasmic adaptor subunit [Gemmatimonadaceae bacterium]
MKKGVKLAIAAVVVAAIVGGAVAVQQQQGNKAVEVRIEPVAARDLVASVTASGQVRPRTKVDLSADITGRVVRLAVQEGDVVSKGQFLLQIDPQQFEATLQRSLAALASAKAQLAQARANAIQATRNYERSREIKRQTPTLISDEQLEQLKTAAEVNKALEEAARFSVEQAEAAVRDARWSLSRTTIIAPMSGKVTRLNVEAGETAIMGTLNKDAATLLTIADVSVYETKIKVDETDVSRIKLGDSAVVEIDAFPDTTFAGRVVRVSNSSVRAAGAAQTTTDQAVDYEVTVQLLNAPPETRPDFSATARIITDVRTSVLSVPIIALTVREEERLGAGDSAQAPGGKQPAREVGKKETEGVFIVKSDNTVAFRPVKVGIAGERYFEVLGGVSAGERIVAGTYQAIRDLRDGARVRGAAADSAKSTVAKAGDKK